MQKNTDSSLEGGSLVSKQAQGPFDMHTEGDVLSLLRVIHVNPMGVETKNLLRDLIFAYRQSQDDALLPVIEKQLSPFGITLASAVTAVPETVSTVAEKKPSVHTLGTSRPSPRFASASKPASEVTQAPKPTEEVPAPAPSADPVPAPARLETPVSTPVASVAPTPKVENSPSVQYGDPMARIQEIKHIVNQKVGNPVKLIESHNEIGHEYMNALLDAMKKASGAVQGDISASMQRLESAFATISALDLNTPVAQVAPTPEPPKPVADPIPSIGIVEPLKQKVEPAFESTLTVKEEKPILTSLDDTTSSAPQEPKLTQSRFTSVKKQLEAVETVPPVAPLSAPTVAEKSDPIPLRAVPIPEQKVETPVTPATPDIPAEPLPEIHSVGKERQLQDLLLAKRQKEAQTEQQLEAERIAAMDPLMTPEVTAGLSQLLSEWSLFKSSGIFGIGPSGKDHVLYKRIAPLTMAAVIAGRFEGATPVIKQSITDYMNGWRYEEGIVHEHTETFEHYLRRVIHHILNKKKLAA